MLGLFNHPPRHSPDHGSAIEPMATASQPSGQHALDAVRLEREELVRAQNPTARHLEQQRSVQLGELITQITTLREQLGSDTTTVERDRVMHSQLTDVLNTILHFSHGQEVTASREDDRSQATGIMPGK